MERLDLNMVDETFELFEGSGDFAESFSLFENGTGGATTPPATGTTPPATGTKSRQLDTEKLNETISSVGSAIGSGVTLVKAYEDPAKAQFKQDKKQKKLELKEVCGRRPLFEKNRTKYNTCVENYMKGRSGMPPTADGGFSGGGAPAPQGMSNNTKIIIAVAVIGVAGFVYWKYFRGKKGANA